ncbi:MAG: hypothetical protein JNJ57_15050 [Saprospiraceae bacterium]|nr:hypothetical protein [Saprospiraceae bacterium]
MSNKSNRGCNFTMLYCSIILLFGNIQCTQPNSEFDHVFAVLKNEFDQNFITKFKLTPENKVVDAYFLFFLYRYMEIKEKRSDISIFGDKYGLQTEASQTYLLMLLWHRDLNQKKLEIETLLKLVNDPKVGVNNCRNQRKINSVYNYRKYQLQDVFQLKLPVRTGEDVLRMAVYFDCPIVDWNFDTSKDLLIDGRLIDKFMRRESTEFIFKVEVEKTSIQDAIFLFRRIYPKDTIDLDLYAYGMKIINT